MLAIYTRKSVEKEGSKSIKEQTLRGIDLAKKLDTPYEVYVDDGISGTLPIDKRPDFSRMIDDIEDGRINAVYAYHHDRIERNPQVRFIFNDILRKNNVRLFTDAGEIDLHSDEQEMLGDMISVMSKFHVRTTKKRVKNAVKRNIAEGRIHGIMAYGYMRGENSMMVINPEEAEVVKLIYSLNLQGQGFVNIAKELDRRGIPTRYKTLTESGIAATKTYEVKNPYTGEVEVKGKGSAGWVQATVRGILYNPIYKGERKHLDKYYHVPQLIIIEPDLWDKVYKQIKARQKPRGKESNYKYLLNGVMVCGKCGKRMTGRQMQNRGYSYRCVDKRQKQGNRCDNRDIRGERLEEIIWNRLFIGGRLMEGIKDYLSKEKNHKKIGELTQQLKVEEKEMKTLEGYKEHTMKLILIKKIDEEDIKGILDQAKSEIKSAKAKIDNIKQSLKYEQEKIEKEGQAQEDLEGIKDSIPFEEKQGIIQKYVKEITVSYSNRMYVIAVFYHLNIKHEVYTIDTRYNLAVESRTNQVIPLSDNYKAKKTSDLDNDPILSRLVMGQLKLDSKLLQGTPLFWSGDRDISEKEKTIK